jgi:hypothetical protein
MFPIATLASIRCMPHSVVRSPPMSSVRGSAGSPWTTSERYVNVPALRAVLSVIAATNHRHRRLAIDRGEVPAGAREAGDLVVDGRDLLGLARGEVAVESLVEAGRGVEVEVVDRRIVGQMVPFHLGGAVCEHHGGVEVAAADIGGDAGLAEPVGVVGVDVALMVGVAGG